MVHVLLMLMLSVMMPVNNETLTITVKDVKPGRGNIVVEVYDSKAYFFKKSVVKRTVKAADKQVEVTLDIAPGTYAIAIYQDVNENKLFDRNFIGLPKEPYGLSNNFKPRFAAPTFEDCRFEFNAAASMAISLR